MLETSEKICYRIWGLAKEFFSLSSFLAVNPIPCGFLTVVTKLRIYLHQLLRIQPFCVCYKILCIQPCKLLKWSLNWVHVDSCWWNPYSEGMTEGTLGPNYGSMCWKCAFNQLNPAVQGGNPGQNWSAWNGEVSSPPRAVFMLQISPL